MTIGVFDPVTNFQLSNIEFLPFDFPSVADIETESEAREIRIRNIGSSVVDTTTVPITVAPRHDIATSGFVVSVLPCFDIVKVNQPLVDPPVFSAEYSSDGKPGSGVYQITILSSSPLEIQVQRGQAPLSPSIPVVADGSTTNTNVINGLDIIFNTSFPTYTGALSIDVTGVGEVINFDYQDNGGQLEARPIIPNAPLSSAFEPIVADNVTPNLFTDLPGIEIVFNSSLTSVSLPLNNQPALAIRDGGQYVEFSTTINGMYTSFLEFSPSNNFFVPYLMGFNATVSTNPTGGTIPAATYLVAIIGKKAGDESGINPAQVATIITTGSTSTIVLDLPPQLASLGYDLFDIYVNQGIGFELQVSDHNFITSPSLTLNTLSTGGAAPPIAGTEFVAFVRAKKLFPARLQTIDRARIFTQALFS